MNIAAPSDWPHISENGLILEGFIRVGQILGEEILMCITAVLPQSIFGDWMGR